MHKINKYSACTAWVKIHVIHLILCSFFDVFKAIITTCLRCYHCMVSVCSEDTAERCMSLSKTHLSQLSTGSTQEDPSLFN